MGCCSAAPLWREKRGDDMQEKIALTGFKGGLVVLKDVLDSYNPSKIVKNQSLGQAVYNVCILLDALSDFELLSESTMSNETSTATVIAATARAVRRDGCMWIAAATGDNSICTSPERLTDLCTRVSLSVKRNNAYKSLQSYLTSDIAKSQEWINTRINATASVLQLINAIVESAEM
ncbi:hypothetical protein EMCRGX_G019620 [Ephydatia muelleri]